MFRVSLAAAALVVTPALAETTLLDIPSGSGSEINWSSLETGLNGVPFSVEHSGMTWRGGGHATEGVVRAWDSDANAPATGLVTFRADEGWAFDSIHFDVSGFKQYQRQARVQVWFDGDLFRDYLWNFNGNSTLIHFGTGLETPVSEITIGLTYFDGVQYAAGLDNIEIGSFSTVPAPGAMALLGLAGVVGNRRRRG
ncbi:MAG: hypothetical protein RLZZ461_31 [Planctomycetota bacterium]|jgi:MYXO-CTERM domain-containing protein